MGTSHLLIYVGLLVSVCLFAGVLIFLEVGRRSGRRGKARHGPEATDGTGAVDGAIFGLLGLLIAFTFSSGTSRFDTRRLQIAEEANTIGTSWLRLDLLPPESQPPLRQLFRDYVDSRLKTYRLLPDVAASLAELARSEALQDSIWARAVAACDRRGDTSVRTLLLGSLNDMIDITTTRAAAARIHPPLVIFVLLFAMVLLCAYLAGHSMADHPSRPVAHMLGFAFILSLTIYVIIDIEFPRAGLIRIDGADQVLVDLRGKMN